MAKTKGPTGLRCTHALPNKFFEFVQARLAVAIGPSPEMAGLVRQYGLGVAADSFAPKDLARRLNRLTADEIQMLKLATHRAAKDLCAEVNGVQILSSPTVLPQIYLLSP